MVKKGCAMGAVTAHHRVDFVRDDAIRTTPEAETFQPSIQPITKNMGPAPFIRWNLKAARLLSVCEESEAMRAGFRLENSRGGDCRMTDTTIVMPAEAKAGSPLSWSAAIAGALAATAVTLIIIALGSGIGLSFASPYSGPSAKTMTIAAAVWLLMAETMGFATGGYLAGRLRSPAYDGVIGETTFRDAAQGLLVWALGVVAMASLAGLLGFFAAGATAHVTAGAAAGAARGQGMASANGPTDYFVDLMFRPAPSVATAAGQRPTSDTVGIAPAGAQPALSNEARAEITRILARSVSQARIDDSDRAYLAQVVAARTGLSPEEAQRRVSEVEAKAREAADTAAKAAAYVSFWTFMALLFGGAAATLGGMLGGQLRDAETRAA
jgi:hypothetical protein